MNLDNFSTPSAFLRFAVQLDCGVSGGIQCTTSSRWRGLCLLLPFQPTGTEWHAGCLRRHGKDWKLFDEVPWDCIAVLLLATVEGNCFRQIGSIMVGSLSSYVLVAFKVACMFCCSRKWDVGPEWLSRSLAGRIPGVQWWSNLYCTLAWLFPRCYPWRWFGSVFLGRWRWLESCRTERWQESKRSAMSYGKWTKQYISMHCHPPFR
jgi:hypothetical protein